MVQACAQTANVTDGRCRHLAPEHGPRYVDEGITVLLVINHYASPPLSVRCQVTMRSQKRQLYPVWLSRKTHLLPQHLTPSVLMSGLPRIHVRAQLYPFILCLVLAPVTDLEACFPPSFSVSTQVIGANPYVKKTTGR